MFRSPLATGDCILRLVTLIAPRIQQVFCSHPSTFISGWRMNYSTVLFQVLSSFHCLLSLEVLWVGEGEVTHTPKDEDKCIPVRKAPRHEGLWRNGGVAPRIYLRTSWMCV